MRRAKLAVTVMAGTLATMGALATSSHAAFHLTKVTEVYPSGNNSFIELQMVAAGQNFFDGHSLRTYASDGNLQAQIPLATVPSGENQRRVLIGDTGVVGRDITYDMLGDTLGVLGPGGAVCFPDATPPDCVSWGNFAGNNGLPGLVGNPVAPGGITAGSSISRLLNRGCATTLDPADDTDNSATDFALGAPTPVGNSAPAPKACTTPTKTPKKCKKKKKKKKKSKKGDASAAAKKKCKKKKKKGKK